MVRSHNLVGLKIKAVVPIRDGPVRFESEISTYMLIIIVLFLHIVEISTFEIFP